MRLLLVVVALTLACTREEKTYTIDERPRPVYTETVQAVKPLIQRRLPGVVQSADTAPLAFEVTGKVDAVLVELGDAFQAGDRLATLETTTFALEVQQQEGLLIEAQARLTRARSDFERKADLVKDEAVSQAAFEASEAEFQSATQAVAVARTRLALAEEALTDATLTAPYDGVVSQRMIEPSQQAMAGSPVFSVQSDGGLELAVSAPENLLGDIQMNAQHAVRFNARKEREFVAQVTEIGVRAGAGNAFPVVLTVLDPPGFLRPGMSAEVTFGFSQDDMEAAPAVPLTALRPDQAQGHMLFVVEGDTLSARPVSLLTTNGQRAYLRDGVTAGEVVVRKGVQFLHDGMKVHVIGKGPSWYAE